MNNKGQNIGVAISFVAVIGIIILTIYLLGNPKEKVNPMDELNERANSMQTSQSGSEQDENTNELSTSQTQNMENQNKRLMKDFTPVAKTTKLEKIDLVEGNGGEVSPGATVSVHYTGAVASTGEIFQSSKDFGTQPVTFPLGGVIKGWTDGIPGMKIGGTRRLIIPAEMAYGANPPQGSGIPANADLVFDVELVEIK